MASLYSSSRGIKTENHKKTSDEIMNIDYIEVFSRQTQPFGHETRRIINEFTFRKIKSDNHITILKIPVYNPLPPPLPVKANPVYV